MPAFEAVSLLAAQSARRARMGETPLVGRDDKLDLLASIYGRAARESRPHLVTVIGQAGVGKSRLRLEFERRLRESDPLPTVREGRCLPYGSGIVYWALGEVLRAEAGILDGDSNEVAWAKLSELVESLMEFADTEQSEPSERKAAMIGRLLGIDAPERGARRRRPAADARGVLLGRALGDRGHGAAQPAGARVRGRPLGRPRNAGPDRVPGPVGAGAADPPVPGA